MKLGKSGLAVAVVLLGAAVVPPATAEGTGYLFVSSEKDNAVIVMDPESQSIIKTIGTAERPRHLAFSPDRSRIYAACGRGNSIDVIDVEKLELVDRVADIEDPELFDLSPDGRIMYISLEDDSALGILDLEAHFAERDDMPELTVAAPDADDNRDEYAGEEEEDEGEAGNEEDEEGETIAGLTRVETGAEPEGVLVSDEGDTVYVTSEVANLVHVVDAKAAEIAANVVAGNRPRRFALTPDGGELWVSNELSGDISIIDTGSNASVGTVAFTPPGFRPEDVTPVGLTMTADGKTVYVGLGRANHVAVVDVARREVQDYILVGERAWNTALTRDESLLYVVNGLSDDISVVDTESNKVVRSIPVGRVPHTVLIDD